MVVELLSPGTEKEDLGQTVREVNQPPTKWEVYERVLRVPYYFVFSRSTNQLKVFQLVGSRYTELELNEPPRVWIEELQLSLGVWQGSYQKITEQWLRWYDGAGNWILTPARIPKATGWTSCSRKATRRTIYGTIMRSWG